MREPVCRARCNQPLALQKIEIGVERDASQGQDRSRADEREFLFQIRQAVADFFRQRLVIGRRAPHRRGDQRALEDEAVTGMLRLRLIGEARAIELFVEENPRSGRP